MKNLIHTSSFFLLLLLPLMLRAGARTEAARTAYINQYKPHALMVELQHGIPASICLAQALLETDAGRSKLNTKANNHFGIKAGRYWQGPTILKIDDKIDSLGTPIPSNFRVYSSASASFRDYGRLLSKTRRYRSLKAIDKADYKSWAYGIYERGYASNPQYAKLLISIIERYDLDNINLMQAQTYTDQSNIGKESTDVHISLVPYSKSPIIYTNQEESRASLFFITSFLLMSLLLEFKRIEFEKIFQELCIENMQLSL